MGRWIWLGLLCLPLVSQAAEMYRWVSPSGVITYSDSAPPVGAAQPARVYRESEAPSEAAPGAEKPAVVLYAFACGPLCDDAMAWLAERNITYSLKNPQTEAEAATELKKMTGVMEVPVLRVGDKHHKGFEPANWTRLLTGAGYAVRAGKP
ncbi:glutaredoxin [Sulfuritortus calidifontis]|uniref:Glutaredoxin n=1 Tax=Sulfuritortus calidifontis TaxID=1914471 RepID=A0A4R3JWC0_9PROT|nr:glutaredoxin family protein [Sulfuritortus calidifontis]TCS72449.1 glutaredoxin [Sulfuritortus calidifontis]